MTAQEARKRLEIAQRIVHGLAARTNLHASLLAGSVAQETADEHSDIDLLNYYNNLPGRTIFDAVLHDLGAVRIGHLGEPDKEEFAARYQVDGIEVQTGGQLVESLERRLDRIASGDVDWISAKVAMGLLEGVPLFGDEAVRGWQGQGRLSGITPPARGRG